MHTLYCRNRDHDRDGEQKSFFFFKTEESLP